MTENKFHCRVLAILDQHHYVFANHDTQFLCWADSLHDLRIYAGRVTHGKSDLLLDALTDSDMPMNVAVNVRKGCVHLYEELRTGSKEWVIGTVEVAISDPVDVSR